MEEKAEDLGIEIFRCGKWVLTDECIYWDGGEYPYPMYKERLWETRPDNENDKFDWPIHLIDKSWLKKQDIIDFNTVFFFAVDYFVSSKPENTKASIYKTLSLQRKFLESKIDN